MQSEEPTIIQSLENHLAEYGHTTVGQDIAAAILVIKDLHQKAALSAAEPVAELQSIDARELDEATQLLPSVMRPSLSKVIIAAIEEQRRIIAYFKRISRARQLAFEAATTPPAPSVAEEIADAVLSWMVRYDLLDAGNEYRAADVIAVLDDFKPSYHAALSAQVQDVAVEDVLSERKRQVEREGWTPEHDDAYTEYELAWAAITYAMAACADSAERAVMDQFGDHSATPGRINENWPWDWKWWKPKDRRRDLVRAAALIIAEIERLDRAAAPAKQEGGTNE